MQHVIEAQPTALLVLVLCPRSSWSTLPAVFFFTRRVKKFITKNSLIFVEPQNVEKLTNTQICHEKVFLIWKTNLVFYVEQHRTKLYKPVIFVLRSKVLK